MGFLVALGSLLPGHVARAWQMRRNHRSGLFMLVLAALLVATGYGLYYAGDEQTRPWISCVHWLLGVAAAGVAPLHVYLGRRSAMAERGRDRVGPPPMCRKPLPAPALPGKHHARPGAMPSGVPERIPDRGRAGPAKRRCRRSCPRNG